MSPLTKLVQLLVLLVFAFAAQAQPAASPPAAGKPASSAAAKPWPLVDGEVIEVDQKEKRATLKHGPIKSIGMDAMTMEFLVPDPKILASLKPGDQIRFAASYENGDYVITRSELVKRRTAQGTKSP